MTRKFESPNFLNLNVKSQNVLMKKYQNKYRTSSTRLQTWDYGNNGAYFITICTNNREPYFGEIVGGVMQLSKIGKIGEQNWLEIPNHFAFIELGNFVVMPNHVHGILIIDKNEPNNVGDNVTENYHHHHQKQKSSVVLPETKIQ